VWARGGGRVWVAMLTAGVVALASLASRVALAADCATSGYYPRARAREAALLEAGELAANGRWSDARAVYLWVLARHQEDPEALFGLARVDAWGGCWTLSESEYRRVLAAHPGDADVRAGYVDLLVWRGRLDEAERMLEGGAQGGQGENAVKAPALLARAARFAYWRGDATTAVRLADDAERGAPDDGEVRAMRDRMFLGEARLTVHFDKYPAGYQNLLSLGTQILERTGRFEVYGGAQLLARYQGSSTTQTVVDGRYPFGASYHPALGATVGVEIAPGLPSNAIPDWSLKGWGMTPIAGPFDVFLAYSFWHYAGDEIVQIVNPSLGVALPHELRLEVRGWIPVASLRGQTKIVGAVGTLLSWSATPRLDAGVTYTYGAEVDRVPALYQLLAFQSHAGAVFVDWLLGRHGGLRPLGGIEYRIEGAVVIGSLEISAYGRW
jgi:tetratricopeptide (TPR) repeat protein